MNATRRIFSIAMLGFVLLIMACKQQTPSMQPGGTAWGVGSFDSNGKRIYFTATDANGHNMTYSGGPPMGMMMGGGRLACVSCHGLDGRGGTHRMQMQTMKAADIRWSVLADMHEMGHGSEERPADNHQGYDFETFRRAVVKGEHPDDDKLSPDMPRWNIDETDLRDLMNYLKSLQ